MLLHAAKKPVDEAHVTKIMEAAGVKADAAKVKALVASLEGVNIEEAIKEAAMPVAVAAAPAAAAKCSVISGATTASHKVVTADVGKYLRVLVTARNSAGSVLSLSKSTTAKATK